jgi:tryptophan synthase beta chain
VSENGRFGEFGGRYVPDTVVANLEELEEGYRSCRKDRSFWREFDRIASEYGGRPTPLTPARRLSEKWGPTVYLKREDLNHTGSHKLNNCIGQILVARRLGKKRIIAETGAGQHGVASATVCALFGLPLTVYMGEEDCRRQELNVFRMNLLGAEVVPVRSGTRTLKDAVSEAFRDWIANVDTTYYLLGSVIGPHPYPSMVRDFQAIIGREARRQILEAERRLPTHVVACVGGGSNAIGIFHPFLDDPVKLFGVEAGGLGLSTGKHSATLTRGRPGVLHGTRTYLLQDEFGQIRETHSVSAGLDYPGVGPEHSHLKETGRVTYDAVTDREALEGFKTLARLEGILPALEPAHAVAYAARLSRKLSKRDLLIVNISGRGDKDVQLVRQLEEKR